MSSSTRRGLRYSCEWKQVFGAAKLMLRCEDFPLRFFAMVVIVVRFALGAIAQVRRTV